MYSNEEIKRIELEHSNNNRKLFTEEEKLNKYFSGYVMNLSTFGVTDGIVYMSIDYITGSLSIDFDMPDISFIEIESDNDLLEFASMIVCIGVKLKLEKLDIVIDFDNNCLQIDKSLLKELNLG